MLSHKQIITRILSGQVKLTAESPFTNKIRNNENEHHNFIQALKNTLNESKTTDFNRFYRALASLSEGDRRLIWPTILNLLLKILTEINDPRLSSAQQISLAKIIYLTSTPSTHQGYRTELSKQIRDNSVTQMITNSHFTSLCLHTLYDRTFSPVDLYHSAAGITMRLIGILSNITMNLKRNQPSLEDIKNQITQSFSIIRQVGTKTTKKTTPQILITAWHVTVLSYIKNCADQLDKQETSRAMCVLLSRSRLQLAYSTRLIRQTRQPKPPQPLKREQPSFKTGEGETNTDNKKKPRINHTNNDLGSTLKNLKI